MSNFIRRYLKEKSKLMLFLILIQAIIYIPLLLDNVSYLKILYPAYLVLLLFVVYLVIDCIKEYRKYKTLEKLVLRVGFLTEDAMGVERISLAKEELPELDGAVEGEYQELVEALVRICKNHEMEANNSREEMLEFVTLWAHQVKTPLTALMLMVQELDAKQRDLIGSRLFEIQQYCDVILQYLRMEGSGSDYAFSKCEVRSMVNQAVKYFARVFIAKGLSVKVEVPEDIYLVTDEKWLVFALQQIISNALKYTEKGTITIDMPTSKSIRIQDTGVGIRPEDLPRIFERGYTGFNGRKDKKATGIGLFLVKNIMDRLNGSVEVTSEIRKGTSVILDLTKM